MKKRFCFLLVFLLCSMPALGLTSDITIFDNQTGSGNTYWSNHNEDQEVEPGASSDPGWDLEGMFYDNGKLSIVGEWNFKSTTNGIGSGDIFISTQGGVSYGQGIIDNSKNTNITNSFGYNYVFDVDWIVGTYTLWQIDDTTVVKGAWDFGDGNPVAYVGGDNDVQVDKGSFSMSTDATAKFLGFTGDTHYTVSGFDLTGIDGFNHSFIAHFTQECGNDVIMGQVPEPATMLLLGMGLLGIGAIGRKLPLEKK